MQFHPNSHDLQRPLFTLNFVNTASSHDPPKVNTARVVAIAVLVWAKYAFGTGFRVFGTLCTVKVTTGHAGGFAITYREYRTESKDGGSSSDPLHEVALLGVRHTLPTPIQPIG